MFYILENLFLKYLFITVWSHSQNGSTGSDGPALWEQSSRSPCGHFVTLLGPRAFRVGAFAGEMAFVDDFTADRRAFWSRIHFFSLIPHYWVASAPKGLSWPLRKEWPRILLERCVKPKTFYTVQRQLFLEYYAPGQSSRVGRWHS